MKQTYSEPGLHYVGPRTKKMIVYGVTLVHILVAVVPGLIMALISWLGPSEILVDKVVLVDSAPNDNTALSMNPGEAPEPTEDLPPPPGEIADLPNIPEPVPEPVVPPKTEPVPPPPDEKSPLPPKEKPKEKPKETPKEKPKTQKPKQKLLTEKDIQKNIKTGKKTTSPQKSDKNKTYSDIASAIRTSANGTGKAGGAGGPKGKFDPNASAYYAKVGAFIRSRWLDQPSVSALGGERPKIRVWFTINASGKILSKKYTPSGNQAMDASVKRLIDALTELPRPPKNTDFNFYVDLSVER